MAHYVCVTGGRDFADREAVHRVLWFLHNFYGGDLRLLHGDASGADTLASEVATELGITQRAFPADWETDCVDRCNPNHRKTARGRSICPAAGIYRNEHMAGLLDRWRHQQHSVQVLAFAGGTGTAHMVDYCESLDIPVDRQWDHTGEGVSG